MFIINPGTEKQLNTSVDNAYEVVRHIIKDLDLTGGIVKRRKEGDDDRGWYAFTFYKGDRKSEVDIPGIDPEIVVKGQPFVSPRLYVNGSSWLYGYALGFINRDLTGEE